MIMERHIGERFNYNGIMLEVVKGESCRNCYFSQECKTIEIVLSLGTSRRDCNFAIYRGSYKRCIKDERAIEIVGHCEPFWRDDDTAINYKKVKESWKDRLVRYFTKRTKIK